MGGSSRAALGRKTVTGHAGQDFPAARRGNPSRSGEKNKCGTLGKHTGKASNMQETVKTVIESGQKHGLSGQKGQKQVDSTLQWGDMMQQHGMQGTVQDAADTAHTVEDDVDDCITKYRGLVTSFSASTGI